MCGIVGYKAFGKEVPKKRELENLLIETQYRGTDATGVAWIENDALQIFKQEGSAKELIKTKNWKKIKVPKVMIMHCRAQTQGTFKNNKNNHPVFNKQGMALIHNGIISNDDAIAKEKGYKLDGQVDSEIILKLIEDGWWDSIKNVEELSGSYACAALYKEKPDELILFRHTSPIAYYIDVARDILFFASVDDILEDAFQHWHRGFVMDKISCNNLSDNTAYLINKDGIADDVSLEPKPYSWSSSRCGNTNRVNTPSYLTGSHYETKCGVCLGYVTSLRYYINYEDKTDTGRYLCSDCYKLATEKNKTGDDNSRYTCPYCKQNITEQIKDRKALMAHYPNLAKEDDGVTICDHCRTVLQTKDIKAT